MDETKKLVIFKKSVRGLLKQNKKSLCDGNCVYLSPEGLRCAIGMLITKESYDPRIENESPASNIVQKTLDKCGIYVDTESDILFLKALQSIHDANEPYEWMDLFIEFARAEFSMSEIEATALVESLQPKRNGK